jgi:catechol 2,3-dioxygenase-like lactoylglutathione lyase family enzyme
MHFELNHLIVAAHDKYESARFLTELFGLDEPVVWGPFVAVQCGNGVTLDYAEPGGDFPGQHYAFLVSEKHFDEIFGRIRERGLTYWADPHQQRVNEYNTNDGGRGLYFDDPSGHHLEILTRPYGGGPGLED